MNNNNKVPMWKVIGVLLCFPLFSYLLSMLLLNRDVFLNLRVDFFTVFWSIIFLWYLLQMGIISKILKDSKLTLRDIGYSFNRSKTIWLISGYLVFAFILFGTVEYALASANIGVEKLNSLSDFSNITPKTTLQRIIFIFAGLVAGLAEELVYRGFAINSLEKHKVNKWIAVILVSIPFVFQHGLKSIDQFWWFFISGLVLGSIFILTKRRLHVVIIIHWVIILSAILAILQILE